MAKNTGHGHRNGAVTGRNEFKVANTWFKRDTSTGRILDGSPNSTRAPATSSSRRGLVASCTRSQSRAAEAELLALPIGPMDCYYG